MAPDPQTPQKPRRTLAQVERIEADFLARLHNEFNIILEVPAVLPGPSPVKRDTEKSLEQWCMLKLRHLCWKVPLDPIWQIFRAQATELYKRWVPKFTPGTPPTTQEERKEFLQCLYQVLEDESKKAEQLNSPSSSRTRGMPRQQLNDHPIEFSVAERNRLRNEMPEPSHSQKPKQAPTPVIRSADTSFTSIVTNVFDSQPAMPNTQLNSFDGSQDEVPSSQHTHYGSSLDIDAVDKVFPDVKAFKMVDFEAQVKRELFEELLQSERKDDLAAITGGPEERVLQDQLRAVMRESITNLSDVSCH
jgi:hypothetical protein